MFTSGLDDLIIGESFGEDIEETCDSMHSEITSPDDGSGVKGNGAGKDIENESFIWYECDIDEANVIDGDPFDFITEAMYQNVINANNISLAVLADNYKYLKENGVAMIEDKQAKTQNNEKKKFSIQKFFKAARDKVMKFFTTVLQKMQELQARFLTLFKKGREAAKKNMGKLNTQVPGYSCKDVSTWAIDLIERIRDNDSDATGSAEFPKKDAKQPASFDAEMNVLRTYGEDIKLVKTLSNQTKKYLDVQERYIMNNINKSNKSDADKERISKDMADWGNYSKRVNAVISVSKNAVSLIMARVNASAKAISGAIKYKEPKENDNKEEKKTATSEAVSFLDALDII